MILDRKTQPALNTVGDIYIPPIQHARLDNGLPISYINIGSQELVKFQVAIPAGIVYQNQSLTAFFTNKMLKEGSQNYSAAVIAQKMDYYGAFFETRITRDFAYFNLFCLNKYLAQVLPLVADMLIAPLFSDSEYSVLREQEKQNFQLRMQKGKNKALKAFNTALFGADHPYGSAATIESYDALQVLDLKSFHQKYYSATSWRIYLSGKVSEDILAIINQFFGALEMVGESTQKPIIELHEPLSMERMWVEQKGAMQTAIKMGCLTLDKKHEDYAALSLAQTIFGGFFGSRLMQNIREDKGYTYGIHSGIQHLHQASIFNISSEVGKDVASKAHAEILIELKRLRTELVGEEEISLVKNYMTGGLLRSLNGPFALGEMMRNLEEFELPENYYSQLTKQVQQVSADEILHVAEKYLHEDKMLTVMSGSELV
ncbi:MULTISPECIES: pitrilysin family protein [unclassified Lentimicrobium]|uniref:M16 family metallopeptidase n=1 Tax=unclassified Lentimicrobium TaxID=2677434 RepID=UPI001554956A|nr:MULTISPECIES: pitrilysin family protein [unclassified Lentimicrobium]NPD47193.1 insulinase family protein [Lentimicrobium sp. S6]NPD84884.1 insulinase family protein [Lentimicrobium sp. L6]